MEFGASKQGEAGIISNQHHDEAEDCSSEESVDDDEEADEASASMGYSAEPSPAVQERPQPRSQAPAALAAMAPGASMGRDVARAENFPSLAAMPSHGHGDDDSDGEGGSPVRAALSRDVCAGVSSPRRIPLLSGCEMPAWPSFKTRAPPCAGRCRGD